MNYRHAFHAGNFADVFKHALLLRLLRAMQRKEKGFLFLDTHAGRGGYDLHAPPPRGRADRPPEWPQGIGRLWTAPDLPPLLAEYVELVRKFNQLAGATGNRLRFYPGSPWLALLVRRPQDRLGFWEKQPAEAEMLHRDFARRRRVSVECGDGYQAPKATLPPPERRALVFIDPPFENQKEFVAVAGALREVLRRLPEAVCAVWYPVTERAEVTKFHHAVRELAVPSLFAEMEVTADPQVRLKGCGLVVLNPPWKIADEIRPVLPVLVEKLRVDAGATSRLYWLVKEA
ncbi:MAG: hypothetical protein A3G75_05155 [Verrucomicrobia bacterium RIFCSPLOWO2_12_FULL_64_8]|nr:MAG: hypothetical protein A3G75_05155 [Verrucomicrobia bacterium RIFCSPLOWO2_12_FULL_64_8]